MSRRYADRFYREPEPSGGPGGGVQSVLAEVQAERARQDAKWGEQNYPDGTGPDLILTGLPVYQHAARADHMAVWAKARCKMAPHHGGDTFEQVLTEEWAEALAEDDPAKLRAELVQVAAVAVQWVEAIDRRTTRLPTLEAYRATARQAAAAMVEIAEGQPPDPIHPALRDTEPSGDPDDLDLDAIEARAAEAWETYGSEWQDAVTKMDALSASVADVAPLAAEVRRLRADLDRLGALARGYRDGQQASMDELTKLSALVRDIAEHGLRADLTPTMPSGDGLYRAFVNYLGECDTTLRDRARRALAGESEGSGDQGRETP